MEGSFVGDKQVDSRGVRDSGTRTISDEELDKNIQRMMDAGKEPEGNKLAGAASRDHKDYDTSKRGGQGNIQLQKDPIL